MRLEFYGRGVLRYTPSWQGMSRVSSKRGPGMTWNGTIFPCPDAPAFAVRAAKADRVAVGVEEDGMELESGVDNMPRGNGTGPNGMGPMTGRGAGYCAGYAAPGYASQGLQGLGRGMGLRRGCRSSGRGLGFGQGFGAGFGASQRGAFARGAAARSAGQGFGRAWGQGGADWVEPVAGETEIQAMEAHMGLLERELQALRARLESSKADRSADKERSDASAQKTEKGGTE